MTKRNAENRALGEVRLRGGKWALHHRRATWKSPAVTVPQARRRNHPQHLTRDSAPKQWDHIWHWARRQERDYIFEDFSHGSIWPFRIFPDNKLHLTSSGILAPLRGGRRHKDVQHSKLEAVGLCTTVVPLAPHHFLKWAGLTLDSVKALWNKKT